MSHSLRCLTEGMLGDLKSNRVANSGAGVFGQGKTMPFIDAGGKQIHYWVGKGRPSEKRETILLIHGAGGGSFTWVCQKGFFEKQFSPIIIELPGHGESGGEGEEEIARYAEQVHLFAAHLGFAKAFWVGHSMGGAIVQTLALTHPEVIQGIVLVGTGARLRILPTVMKEIRNHFEETVQKITRFAYSRKASPEFIERGVKQLLGCGPEVLYRDFLACNRFDLRQEVERIDLPTLVICGKEDELTPVSYSEFLHRRIKGSVMEIIPGAGHMVMMEAPDLFNRAVQDFVLSTTVS
jgi:pimeloyl-ACP methyl ester carboxylesterase